MVDKEEKKKEDKVEPTKPSLDRFRWIIFFTYIAITAVTVVLSLWNVGFDFTKIVWEKLLSDLLINYAITISLMYVSMKDGDIHFKTSKSHPYIGAMEFLTNRAWHVVRTGLSFAFAEYSHKRYQDNLKDYLRFRLQKIGVQEDRILQLKMEELNLLVSGTPIVKNYDGKDVGFDILTPEQFLIICKLKEGKYIYEEIPAEWFLNGVSAKTSDLYKFYSKAADFRKAAKRVSIVYRLAMFLVISAIWAASQVGEGALSAQSIVNAVIRTGTALGAIVSGYMIAKDQVDGEAEELTYKTNFIDTFFSEYNSGIFVPLGMTDAVKAKLEKLEQEAKDDVDFFL